MKITLTCSECGSAIDVHPTAGARVAECSICKHLNPIQFNEHLMAGILEECPSCGRKDFYRQKDFNRRIGVALFIIAAIASIWTYGLSLVVLWLLDLLLFKRLPSVAICYKCKCIFREIKNMAEIAPFNHEMNDRIVYADHDFGGRSLEH